MSHSNGKPKRDQDYVVVNRCSQCGSIVHYALSRFCAHEDFHVLMVALAEDPCSTCVGLVDKAVYNGLYVWFSLRLNKEFTTQEEMIEAEVEAEK